MGQTSLSFFQRFNHALHLSNLPQSQRMIFGVLQEFACSDQVIYTTHSPAFVDIAAKYFENPDNIPLDLEQLVQQIFSEGGNQ